MGKQALLQPGDEDRVELQPLGGVHRHHLDRVLAGLGLVVAGLQRGVGQEGGQRRDDLAGVGIRQQAGGLVDRQRHHLAAEALDRHEGFGGVDQLLQVLHPVLAFALGAVEVDQAAGVEHMLDDLAQRASAGVLAQAGDQPHEVRHLRARRAAQRPDRLVQAAPGGARDVLQLLDRARADAACRKVHHPQEAGVVVRVLDQAQIGQRMLDLGALEEAQPAVDAVGHAGIEQRRLQHARLRVAAVEDGDLGARGAGAVQLLGLLEHPLRLGEVAGRLVHPHRLARARLGAQVLAQPAGVVLDQRIGRIQDVAEGAVVALELDPVAHPVFALEVGHVADPRAPEGVDALVVVADREDRAGGGLAQRVALARHRREHLQPGVLQPVGVLELVDQDVAEARAVVRAQVRVVAQQLEAAQHQLGEVDHALALALVLVGLVDLGELLRLGVAHLDVLRAQAVLLGAGDEPGDLLGHEALLVELHRADHPLDGADRVARVEDLEGLRQIRLLPVRAQEAVAQAVEGADPHAAHVEGQHRRQAREHFLGGLVGEGHRHQAAGRDLAGLQQPGDAGGQHPGLAGAGAGEDQRGLGRQRHRGELFRVEVRQQAGFGRQRGRDGRGRRKHRGILRGAPRPPAPCAARAERGRRTPAFPVARPRIPVWPRDPAGGMAGGLRAESMPAIGRSVRSVTNNRPSRPSLATP